MNLKDTCHKIKIYYNYKCKVIKQYMLNQWGILPLINWWNVVPQLSNSSESKSWKDDVSWHRAKSGKWLQNKRCSTLLPLFPMSAKIRKYSHVIAIRWRFFFLANNGWHCSHHTEIFKQCRKEKIIDFCL